jgi:hypothetical protein
LPGVAVSRCDMVIPPSVVDALTCYRAVTNIATPL